MKILYAVIYYLATVLAPPADPIGIAHKNVVYALLNTLIVEMGYVNTTCGVGMGLVIMGKHATPVTMTVVNVTPIVEMDIAKNPLEKHV
jgi:hypothetical protein